MKTFIPVFAILLMVVGCTPEDKSDLATLNKTKERLKEEYSILGDSIAMIEEEIMLMDTTNKSPMVSLHRVTTSTFDNYFWLQGNVETDYNAMVYPEMNGRIRAIRVEEGQHVSKGQALIELDTDVIQKNLAEVETQYALAVDVFNRQKNLWDQKIGSEVQFLEAKTRKEGLEGTMATLKAQMDMGIVRAPFAGVVDDIVPKMGEMASPMMPVARVVNLEQMYIVADVPENYFGKINSGDLVEVDVANKDTLKAAISRVGNFIKPENRTFEIRVNVDTKTKGLIPNQVASMRVNDFHADSAVVLPASLISQDARGMSFVYVVQPVGDEYKAEKTFVEPGRTYNGLTMVVSGLSGNEQIVDKGSRRVINGGLVRVQ
jgi:membrane fusion protein, multidrug efflux system